jgi:hypothetical protein
MGQSSRVTGGSARKALAANADEHGAGSQQRDHVAIGLAWVAHAHNLAATRVARIGGLVNSASPALGSPV